MPVLKELSSVEDLFELAKQYQWIFPADHHHDIYFRRPIYFSLLAFGQPGLDHLQQLHALGGRIGFDALLVAALGDTVNGRGGILFALSYLEDAVVEGLSARIAANIADMDNQRYSRSCLSRCVRTNLTSLNRRDELAQIVSPGLGPKALRLIFDLIGSASLIINDQLCEEAEALIAQDSDENDYQQFFETYPSLLDPLASSVVPRQALAEMWKTDFVIRRFDEQYVFVELEKPRDHPFTKYPHPSASLSYAIGQVVSWFTWVEDNIAYAQRDFPNIHSPRGLVIIGRDSMLSAEQRRMLRALNDLMDHRILIWTYDEVVRNARSVLKNLTSQG